MPYPGLKHGLRHLRSHAGLALLMLFAVSARAGLINASRSTTFAITYLTTDTFSDASVFYDSSMTVNYTGTGPTTESEVLNFFSTVVPGSFFLNGNATLSSGGPPPIAETLTVGSPTWDFRYNSDASTTPGQSFLTLGTSGGLATLNLSANSSGFVDTGNTFTVGGFFPGNFSVSGTGAGDHMLTSLDPGFTITDNFVYSPAAHVTIFAATDSNYQGEGINLNFTLYGVPEPATGALMGIGILAVGFAARRRRSIPTSSSPDS